jgi:hypothetical protein
VAPASRSRSSASSFTSNATPSFPILAIVLASLPASIIAVSPFSVSGLAWAVSAAIASTATHAAINETRTARMGTTPSQEGPVAEKVSGTFCRNGSERVFCKKGS